MATMALVVADVSPADPRRRRASWAIAVGVTLVWFLAFNSLRPDYLVDEAGHLGNIYHLIEGKPGWPEQMTMLPGYHLAVVGLWLLHPPVKLLTLARLVSTLAAVAALFAFSRAWTCLHGRPAGPAVLLLAVLPIAQPFTGLAYTDIPALACVLIAVAAHLGGRRALAALLLGAAICVRQTNIVWVGFLIAAEFVRPVTSRREFLQNTRWLLVVFALAAIAAGIALGMVGRLTPGTQTGNDLRLNPATLHFAGLVVLVLGLPVWLDAIPVAGRHLAASWRARPAFTVGGMLAGVAVAALLAATFANPHPWNRDLFWDGCTFTLLRNWPLVALDTHPWFRAVSGLNVVLMITGLAVTFHGQSHHLQLWLAIACGALVTFTNGLVEPRYLIPGAVLTLLYLDLSPTAIRRLTAWWLLLCAIHAPFIATGRSLW